MTKFVRSFMFVLIAMSLLLAACGGSAPTQAPPPAEPTTAPAEPADDPLAMYAPDAVSGDIITAGSSSGITDGGAALVLASDQWAADRGLKPLARVTGWASAGVDPRIMGIGPVPAIKKLYERHGYDLDSFDLIELNEAFAAQVLAVLKDVPIPREKLNVNGGAIALGHPIGCSGARIVVTLLYEMLRRDVGSGLATLCVSGGMGMALAIERV